jgi:hypothetical protein
MPVQLTANCRREPPTAKEPTEVMTSDRWEQINRLYHAALEVEEKDRTSFLSEVCGADGPQYNGGRLILRAVRQRGAAQHMRSLQQRTAQQCKFTQ